jgi:hypothetical protein
VAFYLKLIFLDPGIAAWLPKRMIISISAKRGINSVTMPLSSRCLCPGKKKNRVAWMLKDSGFFVLEL